MLLTKKQISHSISSGTRWVIRFRPPTLTSCPILNLKIQYIGYMRPLLTPNSIWNYPLRFYILADKTGDGGSPNCCLYQDCKVTPRRFQCLRFVLWLLEVGVLNWSWGSIIALVELWILSQLIPTMCLILEFWGIKSEFYLLGIPKKYIMRQAEMCLIERTWTILFPTIVWIEAAITVIARVWFTVDGSRDHSFISVDLSLYRLSDIHLGHQKGRVHHRL